MKALDLVTWTVMGAVAHSCSLVVPVVTMHTASKSVDLWQQLLNSGICLLPEVRE